MADLFKNISEEEKKVILHELGGQTLNLKNGEDLMYKISPGKFIGFVEAGKVDIVKTDSAGSMILVESVEGGGAFGPYYTNESRGEISIFAKGKTRVLLIDYELYTNGKSDSAEYSTFNFNLAQIIIAADGAMMDRISVLMQKSISTKLLEFFNSQSKKRGKRTFTMPFTFTDLARWLGVDRSAMQRELKNLKDEEFISVSGRKVTVLKGTDSTVYNRFW
jgi:CRP-like cAMP-binding protein